MGVDALLLNAEPDGTFPHHDPNPLKEESRVQAAGEVVEPGGGIRRHPGRRRRQDPLRGREGQGHRELLPLLPRLRGASDARTEGAAIVYDLISSRVLPERIRELGGKPVVSRVGYTFLYDQMVASRAVFGAETSGHVYFKVSDTYYTESAAYALAVILRLLAARGAAALGAGPAPARPLRAVARDQCRGGGQAEGDGGDRAPVLRRQDRPHGRRVHLLRRLLVQRAAEQHRAASPPSPGGAERGDRAREEPRRSRRILAGERERLGSA